MNIRTTNHPSATEHDAQVQAYLQSSMPNILATEVLAEVERRSGSGQQYCTFPNSISDVEKAKVEAKGYTVTKNYIDGKNLGRTAGEQYYIGFQVAMNSTVTAEMYTMVISQEESNGIPSGGGGSITVDDMMSLTSTNPVQNKVITAAMNQKPDRTEVDRIVDESVTEALQNSTATTDEVEDMMEHLDEL